MKKTQLFLFLLSIFLISSSGVTLFYSLYIVKDVIVYPADVSITAGKVGFNLDKDKIHFGLVKKKSVTSKRSISVSNSDQDTVEVTIKGEGQIKKWLMSEVDNRTISSFYLKSNESKNVNLFLVPDSQAEVGKTYTGNVKIIIKRVLW